MQCAVWKIRTSEGLFDALYLVDNNQYAFQFDDEVYHYFTEYVLNQEKDRLQWGEPDGSSIMWISERGQESQKKIAEGGHDVTEELCALKKKWRKSSCLL